MSLAMNQDANNNHDGAFCIFDIGTALLFQTCIFHSLVSALMTQHISNIIQNVLHKMKNIAYSHHYAIHQTNHNLPCIRATQGIITIGPIRIAPSMPYIHMSDAIMRVINIERLT